jgi:hypothetical protein
MSGSPPIDLIPLSLYSRSITSKPGAISFGFCHKIFGSLHDILFDL